MLTLHRCKMNRPETPRPGALPNSSHSSPHSSKWAVLALLAIALIWGYNWVQMKIAVQYASPFTFAALRNLLGGLSLILVMVWLRKPLEPVAVPGTFVLGCFQMAGMYGLATWALVSGGAGKTAVLVYTMPFWGLLLAWIALDERIRRFQWVAVGLGLVGFLFILEPQNLAGTVMSKVLAVLSGVSWAIGSILLKKLQQSVKPDLLSLTAWQTLFGAVPLVLVALLLPTQPIVWSPQFVFALFYAVIPSTAIAQVLWFYALSNLSTGTASLGTLLNPVFGVFFASLQLGERPGTSELVGMMLIVVALVINSVVAIGKGQEARG